MIPALLRRLFDAGAFTILLLAVLVAFESDASILYSDNSAATIAALTAMEAAIAGTLGSISGMLIAAFLISAQVGGHRPYSRLMASFRGATTWYPFVYLFASIVTSIAILIFLPRMSVKELKFVDASVLLAGGTLFALASLMTNSFSILSAASAGVASLRGYTARAVRKYGLLEVDTDAQHTILGYQLRPWGYRHNFVDPLGPYHDLLMEAISDRQRITLHLYLSCLMKRVAGLNGVRFGRSLGRQKITDLSMRRDRHYVIFAWINKYFIGRPADRIQVTVHALHYLVRRSKKLVDEWGLDNHRQVFVIIVTDLALSLRNQSSSEFMINVCIDAVVRINLDYATVLPYGNYEPTQELFRAAIVLHRAGYLNCYNRMIDAISYLDLHTPYVTRRPLVDWAAIEAQLPNDLLAAFTEARKSNCGRELMDVLPGNLWA